jgi:hypothetical protein
MNPLDFMQTALRLSAGDEANKRSAVSRAYYCVYHLAQQFIVSCGVVLSKSTPQHEPVSRCLQHSGEEKVAEAGRLLKTLRLARNDADYDLSNRRFTAQAPVNVQLKLAQEILALLAGADSNLVRARVREYAHSILKLSLAE